MPQPDHTPESTEAVAFDPFADDTESTEHTQAVAFDPFADDTDDATESAYVPDLSNDLANADLYGDDVVSLLKDLDKLKEPQSTRISRAAKQACTEAPVCNSNGKTRVSEAAGKRSARSVSVAVHSVRHERLRTAWWSCPGSRRLIPPQRLLIQPQQRKKKASPNRSCPPAMW